MDLFLLYDEQIADDFVSSYEAASGTAVSEGVLWDLWAVARSNEAVEDWVGNYWAWAARD